MDIEYKKLRELQLSMHYNASFYIIYNIKLIICILNYNIIVIYGFFIIFQKLIHHYR